MIPVIPQSVLNTARAVWEDYIDKFGGPVALHNADDTEIATVQGVYKRPKILGLFDRTQASYDQERYMLMLKASDFIGGVLPEKFMKARWDEEDHSFISVTKVEFSGTVFGYRVMVKG